MENAIQEARTHLINKILEKQDAAFRWGYDEKKARLPKICSKIVSTSS